MVKIVNYVLKTRLGVSPGLVGAGRGAGQPELYNICELICIKTLSFLEEG